MLNLPESIKALFKRDSVLKNFRVHFPNGGFSDITNENIVEESVKFSESLCSQNIFRFGCAEAQAYADGAFSPGGGADGVVLRVVGDDGSGLPQHLSVLEVGTPDMVR